MKRLTELFVELFRISLFVIGGGYSILMVSDRRFAKLGWTEEGELIDHLPVFQTIPGLIATHTAVYVGRKRAGRLGAAVGVIAVAIPAVAIFTGVTICYRMIPLGNPWLESAFVGLRAALTGIIIATIVKSWRKSLPDAFAYALMIAAALAIGYFHIHIAAVLLLSMLLGSISVNLESSKVLVSSDSSPTLSDSNPTLTDSKVFQSSWLALLLFAQYGALCFGGGFVIVPMYLSDFIGASAPYLQIAESEFGDIMALSQMTPGPIGVNCATFFGYRLAGALGALIASAMLLLPGSLLCYLALSSLDKFKTSKAVKGIMRGIRPASIALMLVALIAFAKMTVFDGGGAFHIWGLLFTIIAMVTVMSKKINIILLIILCAFAASLAHAEPSTFNLQPSTYPDADTVVIEEIEDVEYFPDGTYKSVEESWTKALTEAGRRELGVESVSYNRRYGTARIAEVAIIGADGARRTVDISKTMKDTTDNSSASANIYDPLDRKIVCSIPGVKVGDTVYVRKERSTFAARCQNQWADISVFEGFSPIEKSTLKVKCPKERPIKSAALRHPLGNVVSSAVTNDDGSVILTWCATNSPQAFPEPNMPAAYRQLQHLSISTAADWKEMSKWYWELCAPHLAKTNAAMVAKATELGSIADIYKFVSQEIRYMGLTMEDTSPGYAPHDVDITFDNRYGVCRDKAGLLTAMLRLAGFDAYPVLIMAGSAKHDPEVPSPYFNHAIVAVSNPITNDQQLTTNNYLLLDPTDESSKDFLPSYESDCSYLVARPDGETLLTTPMPPAKDNLLSVDSHATLAEDGSLLIESAVVFRGLNDNLFRRHFLGMKPESRRKFFEKVMKGAYPGAELLKCEIEPKNLQDTAAELKAVFSATVPDAILRGETTDRLSVGLLSGRIGIANMLLSGRTALEKRRFPLRLSSTAGVDERLTIALGDSLGEVKTLPESLVIDGPYEYRLSSVVTNGELQIRRGLMINSLEFSPEEYSALRENIKRVEAAERGDPVFEKNRFANADVHYLFRGSSVDFTGERSWVTTNTVVKRILTYDGKKGNAELEFSYNPLWRKTRVLKATVTNRRGETVSIGEKEVNEFDCGWAAGAPRYPASRELVVNLPSVEIGCVITTVVESVVTDAPSEYCHTFFYDVYEPTDVLATRIGGEKRTVFEPKRLASENMSAPGWMWRDSTTIARGTFAAAASRLRKAVAVNAIDPPTSNLQPSTSNLQPSLQALRDWMAKYVRIAGPSLYEVPLDKQLTDPATVIAERYATRLDYIRTLCALLKGEGYDADIVFAANDRGVSAASRKRMMSDFPDPEAFSHALCRVCIREGGFLGFGGEEKIYFLGTENEYTPIGVTAFDGCDYFDPVSETFGVVKAAEIDQRSYEASTTVITVRENGAVDYDYEQLQYGVAVGRFRRLYAEMLPEERSRHYQRLLGLVAQAASATKELETDVEGYPARLAFSCFVPDYAVVKDGAVTLDLTGLGNAFPLVGKTRKNPIGVASSGRTTSHWRIIFPEGYTQVESLPESYAVRNPLDRNEIWWEVAVASHVENGRLIVEITEENHEHDQRSLAAEYFPLLKELSRRSTARPAHTLTVRGDL